MPVIGLLELSGEGWRDTVGGRALLQVLVLASAAGSISMRGGGNVPGRTAPSLCQEHIVLWDRGGPIPDLMTTRQWPSDVDVSGLILGKVLKCHFAYIPENWLRLSSGLRPWAGCGAPPPPRLACAAENCFRGSPEHAHHP